MSLQKLNMIDECTERKIVMNKDGIVALILCLILLLMGAAIVGSCTSENIMWDRAVQHGVAEYM